MVAWSVFAFGGVYRWAGAPLVGAGGLLVALARPRIGYSRDTRLLDGAVLAILAAVAVQLLPLPAAARALLSPAADATRAALQLAPDGAPGWRSLSLAPGATAYALALLATGAAVFWTARQACARGATRPLIRAVAFIGLAVAVVAIVQASSSSRLIYGRWLPQDVRAQPFGPFVNRNHFSTWVLMAFPLSAGYVAAAVGAHRQSQRFASEIAALLRGLGSSALWAALACGTMALSLVAAASRAGLIAFGVSVACGAWMGRRRLTGRGRALAAVALLLLAAFVVAYANFEMLLLRVEETLDVGAGGRPIIWRETLRIARDFPLAGVGLGGFRTAMLVYQEMDRTVFINQAHSQYLQWMTEGGLLLGAPAVAAIVAFVLLFRRRMARDRSASVWLRIGAATAIVAVAVQSYWETGLRMPANGLLFALAAAIAVHRPAESETND